MSVYNILQELNLENGSKYKLATLQKYVDNEELKMVLKMAYDGVSYTYGISMKNAEVSTENYAIDYTLMEALDVLRNEFVTRNLTGNAAKHMLNQILVGLSDDDRDVFIKVINRDLRVNFGTSTINKVFKGLVTKPVYMRCGLLNKKSAKKINFPAIVQLKADGTYREFCVDEMVTAQSRSGEEYEYPIHFGIMKSFPAGYYHGELTVLDDEGKALPRSEGNGLINSDNPPHDRIKFDVWGYVTPEEYTNAANRVKNKIPYKESLEKLEKILDEHVSDEDRQKIEIIEGHEVQNIREAYEHCQRWMEMNLEGAVLKDTNGVFRDGTSAFQLKMKKTFSIDVRVTGFLEGRKGTKREATFGGITYSSDDNMIKGAVSGFSDKELKDINSNRNSYIGKIIEIEGNDLTMGRSNDYYAVSHPRFVCVRDDKDYTDTLERAKDSLESSYEI